MSTIPPLLAPKAGQICQIDGHPGTWQISAQSPKLRLWWAMPWSDDARTDPDLWQGHIKAHVIDIKNPTFLPGGAMAILRITGPQGERTRRFTDLEEAAKFGVAYYLTDNGYASRAKAKTAADKIRTKGAATVEGDAGTFAFEVLS
ncbi:hypothetical protein [Brachybacterium kimchii]|uniref:Uncharacterized protein n=1 Tax=Brachybacterium kimchii TaxID=2942909 RepID=A0ABY4N4G6_9MICO|nr:hypothetical protein [Brachybacterium kimchii]UQN29460.1 hypothetical protein M4486_17775 [Brachybacterium kimchii]